MFLVQLLIVVEQEALWQVAVTFCVQRGAIW